MTDQWNYGTGAAGTQAPENDRSRNDRWIRRPRRSSGDRKIAGVAGGLGRAFGIDPVLIRVAFVVLTVFGGFGGLLYVLGWLLLPSDGDEVSAAEALLGRGRSSVPPALAVGLGVVAVISAFSMFSWGLPFLPLAIGGVIVLAIMRKRGRLGHQGDPHGRWNHGNSGANSDWMQRTDVQMQAFSQQAQQWAEQARSFRDSARAARRQGRSCGSRDVGRGPGGWGNWAGQSGWGRWGGIGTSTGVGGTGGTGGTEAGNSPFEQPAFWDQPQAGTRVDRPAPGSTSVNMSKPAAPGAAPSDDQRLLDDPSPRTAPPAWDPLGVAPFAWDLPEPTPLAPPVSRTRSGGGAIARVALGATLFVGGLTAAGVFLGWWALTWAQVSGIALAVLAVGLLISALRGRGYSLIGPGVFLSLVTMALAVTGVSGTSGYGATDFHPTQLSELQSSYSSNAGQITVDLSAITLPKGTSKTVTIDLKGGHAEVVVPGSMNVIANCDARVGHADCLGKTADGMGAKATNTQGPGAESGTLTVDVNVNAGFAEVTNHA